jgi:N-carbamoyl-L-amino-acid hydrolase
MMATTVNGARLWSDLMALGAIGALSKGGLDRSALTGADRDARNLFAHWCREARLSMSVDRMGNMFARREGSDSSLAPVLIGSHLDTQAPGGKFDGILGVLGGLEVLRTLEERGIRTLRSVEVVNWTNEEGVRFWPGLMGSSVFAGALELEAAHAATDRTGARFGDELRRIGYAGPAPVGGRAIDSYFELHNEQGPVLEDAGVTIGAVTHSHHTAFVDVECVGANAHTQSMPMARRRNALVGAARLIEAIDRVGHAYAPAGAASSTVLDCWPNNRINIPNRAVLSYGLIHPDEGGISAMSAEIDAAQVRIADQTGLAFRTMAKRGREPFHFSEELIALVERAAAEIGVPYVRMRTRPGHDAFNMVTLCPTELIFVPSVDGVSHCEEEWTSPEHCTAGVEVLYRAVQQRAGAA